MGLRNVDDFHQFPRSVKLIKKKDNHVFNQCLIPQNMSFHSPPWQYVLVTGWRLSSCTPVFSINKTDRHDILVTAIWVERGVKHP